jgi:hypothetical protein
MLAPARASALVQATRQLVLQRPLVHASGVESASDRCALQMGIDIAPRLIVARQELFQILHGKRLIGTWQDTTTVEDPQTASGVA